MVVSQSGAGRLASSALIVLHLYTTTNSFISNIIGRSPFGLRSSVIVLRRPDPKTTIKTIQGMFYYVVNVELYRVSIADALKLACSHMWEMPRGCHVAAKLQFGSSRVEMSTNQKLPRGTFFHVSTLTVMATVALNVTVTVTVTVSVTVAVNVTVNWLWCLP